MRDLALISSEFTVRCGSTVYGTHTDFRTAKIQQIRLLIDIGVEATIDTDEWYNFIGHPSAEQQLDVAILHHKLGI